MHQALAVLHRNQAVANQLRTPAASLMRLCDSTR
jgi:hypothetical protein